MVYARVVKHYVQLFMKERPMVRRLGIAHDDSDMPDWWIQPETNWSLLMFLHHGSFELDGTTYDLQPHDVVIVRPGARCRVIRKSEGATIFYFFKDELMVEEPWFIPVHARLGPEEGPHWERLLRLAVKLLPFTLSSANSFLLSLLWSLAAKSPPRPRNSHIERAEAIILASRGRPLRVADVAKDLNLSHSQLDRIFAAELGTTPHQFILECRAKAVVHAIRTSTKPLKEIAIECGFADLQSFSRFVRARAGRSPREVRAAPEELSWT